MTFNRDQVPTCSMQDILEEATITSGFTLAEIVALLDCELNTDQLLEYITAVMSKRMN